MSWRSRWKRRPGSGEVLMPDDEDRDDGAEWDRARDRWIDEQNEVL